jgi:putative phosphoribosyl transferase
MSDTPEMPVTVDAAGVALTGDLAVPYGAGGLVVFAHGSGSSRHSPRNREVAAELRQARLGTLLLDLLIPEEAEVDERTGALRFDIALLARRLAGTLDWVEGREDTTGLRVGLFGASTGAAAALVAAAARPDAVSAVVSRGGRPDLAGEHLGQVRAPTLLIVGGADEQVLDLNRQAMAAMGAEVHLEVVEGAGHLFAERGALGAVARLAADWCNRHLPPERA